MKKISKSILSVLLIATMLFSTVIVSSAQGDVVTGKADSNFICEFDTESGVLTVSGLGMLFAGDVESALKTEDLSGVKEIVIKEGVTLFNVFGWEDAHNFDNVTAITLPKSLKRIGKDAFSKCAALQTVNYGGSQADWAGVIIGEGNDAVKNATLNYDCQVPAAEGADTYDYSMVVTKKCADYDVSFDYYSGQINVAPASGKKGVSLDEGLWLLTDDEPLWFDGYYTTDYLTSLVVEEGIASIGTNALINLEIQSISLPKSLVTIEREAFGDSNMFEKSELKKVYYAGSKAAWGAIDIGVNNVPLDIAEKIFAEKVLAKELNYTLSKKSFVYNGKEQYPTVTVKDKNGKALEQGKDYYVVYLASDFRATGKHTVVVKLMGEYKGQKTLNYFVRAQAPVVSKVAKRAKAITATWEKYNEKEKGDISRFEVQYSTNKSFKNAKIITMKNPASYAKKITGLKTGTRYYVRVRALTSVEGGYIRSAWSNVKYANAG